LDTLLFARAENTNSWRTRYGDLQRVFPLDVLIVHLSTLAVTTDGERLTCGASSLDKTVCIGSMKFIADHFDNLSLSLEGSKSDVVFMGMAHNWSPSLHAILMESIGKDDTT
jgi:hypothetical protein